MKIINLNKNCVLADKIYLSNKFFSRLSGLLRFKRLDLGKAMILEPSNSVHTFFMRFAIDVLFVDKNNKIVKMVKNMRPFRLTSLCFNSNFVIELPAGKIEQTKTQVGDLLKIEEN